MVSRGNVFWADLGPPHGRRPVCVLTRNAALAVLTSVTCVPITRTIRGIRSEVEVGLEEGLLSPSVINGDNVLTISRTLLDSEPVGRLSVEVRARLDQALRYALDIRY